MPNWCYNRIEISGESESFNKFKEKLESLKESNTIMTDLVGLGDNVPADYHDQGWYEHNIGRFGTKWDFGYKDAKIDIKDDNIVIEVDTAWSPPAPFVMEMCSKYQVTSELTYEEPGMDFAGTIIFDDKGDVIDSDEYSINEGHYWKNREYFWELVENEVEYVAENVENADDYLDSYPFVEIEDIPKLKMIFENYKKRD